MRILRYLALIALFAAPLSFAPRAHAQVAVGIGIGPVVGYPAPVALAEPVCAYGYYPYYPYACAPYGFYGPSYFVGGIFIGAGPFFHGYGYGFGYPYYGRIGYGYGYGGYRGGYGYGGGYGSRAPIAQGFRTGTGYGNGGIAPRTGTPFAGGNTLRTGGSTAFRGGSSFGGSSGFRGGSVGGGFHGGGGSFHGGGGGRR